MNENYIGKIIKFKSEYFVIIGYDYFCEKYICKNLRFKNGSYTNMEINVDDFVDIEKVYEETKIIYEELELVNNEINSVYEKIKKPYNTTYNTTCFVNMFLRLREIKKNIKSLDFILKSYDLSKEEEQFYLKELNKCYKGKRRVFKRLYSYVNRKTFDKFIEVMERYEFSLNTVKYKKEYLDVLFENLNILKEKKKEDKINE